MEHTFEASAPVEVHHNPLEVRIEGRGVLWTPRDVDLFLGEAFPRRCTERPSLRRLTVSEVMPRDPREPHGVWARTIVQPKTGERSVEIALPEDEGGYVRALSGEELYQVLLHELANTWDWHNDALPIPVREGLLGWALAVGGRHSETQETRDERLSRAHDIYTSFFQRCVQAWRGQQTEEAAQLTLIAHGFTFQEVTQGMVLLNRVFSALEPTSETPPSHAVQVYATRANQAIRRLDRLQTEHTLLREIEAFPPEWRELTEHACAYIHDSTSHDVHERPQVHALLSDEDAVGALSPDEERICQQWLDLMSHVDRLDRLRGQIGREEHDDRPQLVAQARTLAGHLQRVSGNERIRIAAERAFDVWLGATVQEDD